MPELLCKEITADVIGIYLTVYRDAGDNRREQHPQKFARDLVAALTGRGRRTQAVAQLRARRNPVYGRSREQSVFLVNDKVLVLVMKVVHLNYPEREALEKLLSGTTCLMGLILNFGGRAPEFWHSQAETEKV